MKSSVEDRVINAAIMVAKAKHATFSVQTQRMRHLEAWVETYLKTRASATTDENQ